MFSQTAFLPVFIISVILLASVGVVYIVVSLKEQQQLRRRLTSVMNRRGSSVDLEETLFTNAPRRNAELLLLRLVPTLENFSDKLRRARWNINLSVYVMVVAGLALVASFFVPAGPVPAIAWPPIFIVLFHLFFEHAVLRFQQGRIRHQILVQLPNTMDLVVRSLRVGQPIDACLQVCATEIEKPLGKDFERIVSRVNVGTPVAEAIDSVAYDSGVREFEFFATACRVQMEAGGNLADALGSLAETVRARLTMRMKIEALAAEGKMSAWVIGALPFLLVSYFEWINPDYMTPLFHTHMGKMLVVAATVMVILGIIVMVKLIRIKI